MSKTIKESITHEVTPDILDEVLNKRAIEKVGTDRERLLGLLNKHKRTVKAIPYLVALEMFKNTEIEYNDISQYCFLDHKGLLLVTLDGLATAVTNKTTKCDYRIIKKMKIKKWSV